MSITTDGVDVPPDLGGVTLVHWPRDEALRSRPGRSAPAAAPPARHPTRRHPSSGTSSKTGCGCLPDDDELRACGPTRCGGEPRPPSPPWPILDVEGILRVTERPAGGDPADLRPASWPRCSTPRVRWCRGSAGALEAGWPGGAPNSRLLDRRIMLLRGRIEPLGLVIRTVRGRGFLLERTDRLTSRTVVAGHGPLAPRVELIPAPSTERGWQARRSSDILSFGCTLRGLWGRRGPRWIDNDDWRQLRADAAASELATGVALHVALRVQPAGRHRVPPHPPRAHPRRRPHGRGPRRPRGRRGIGRRPHADRHRAVRPGRDRPPATCCTDHAVAEEASPRRTRGTTTRPSPTCSSCWAGTPPSTPSRPSSSWPCTSSSAASSSSTCTCTCGCTT